MKPVQTKFGQAMQLAEARQQVAGLQVQVEKLKGDIKELRDKDRAIFDDLDREIAALKEMARDYQRVLATIPDVSVWSCDYATFANWQQQKEKLEVRAQAL
ncbi:MAG TPA: hypothetical protein VHL10_03075, partial [Nitrososphaera sp.]|nr:hypothetical protein [Nitrososphaera sp.]